MASQLSGDLPNAFDNRSAISGLMPLLPVITLFNVEGDTARLTA